MAIDEVSEALSDLKDRWKASCEASSAHAQSLRSISGDNAVSLPRLNALAQDSLSSLRSLQRQFEILSLQLIRFDFFFLYANSHTHTHTRAHRIRKEVDILSYC